jgi:integrase
MRLHDLRHLSATLGLASGDSLKEVSDRLGHSSIAITADIYAQVTTETARSSAERLAQHLEGGSKSANSTG